MEDRRRQFSVGKRGGNPKRVRMTGKFCTFGRVGANHSTSGWRNNRSAFIVPVERNSNNNWEV